MKIAYLGKTQLSDVDISYLHEAQRLMDITYYIEISPRYLHGVCCKYLWGQNVGNQIFLDKCAFII